MRRKTAPLFEGQVLPWHQRAMERIADKIAASKNLRINQNQRCPVVDQEEVTLVSTDRTPPPIARVCARDRRIALENSLKEGIPHAAAIDEFLETILTVARREGCRDGLRLALLWVCALLLVRASIQVLVRGKLI